MFIQILEGKCTRRDELRRLFDRWQDEVARGAEGWLGGTYGFTDDDLFVGVVRFETEEAAAANSTRQEQSDWWAETEALFDGPVEFHDCNDVSLLMSGGSDQAAFVQVIRGKTDDRTRLKAMLNQNSEALHAARPEILGGTLAIEEDGTFTQTVGFLNEAAARAGEAEAMPEEVRQDFDTVTHDVSYLDLPDPWFASPRS